MSDLPAAEHLTKLRERSTRLIEDAHQLVGPLTTAQLHWSPGETRWSIAQCLAHLVRTIELWTPKFERAMERATLLGRSDAPFRSGFLARWMISMMRADSPKKLKAPPAFQPESHPPDDVFGAFLDSQARVDGWIANAVDRNLNKVKVSSPFAAIVRLRLGDALDVLVTHAERHLQQIRNLRQESGFPR
ncbi:MAG: DinB family protein [Planctomycetes bacterium]|nr:DinB family protein [Planctomycetota bacterium]MCB9890876.1 DinB family protein [Planctomycetota bacterium]